MTKLVSGSLKKGLEFKHLIAAACLFAFLISTMYAEIGVLFGSVVTVILVIAIMTSVHHAGVIAHKIGEGLGTLVLALSVTVIEVGLILSLMGKVGEEANFLARDTIFAAIMIIMNGMVGLCLILGGLRYKEQEFQVQGSRSLLVVLVTLSTLVFILPNYTVSTTGPTYHPVQLSFIGAICLILYLLFIFFQTKSHTEYFEPTGTKASLAPAQKVIHDVTNADAWWSFVSLVASLISVIGLAKEISPLIETGIQYLGAPKATVGVIIAAIVLAPESWAAANASRANRLQTSLNLALGSGIASIALTIPAVIVYSLAEGQPLILGLDAKNTVFLLLTFLVGTLTLGSGKSTLLQGAIHAVILLAYLVMSFIP